MSGIRSDGATSGAGPAGDGAGQAGGASLKAQMRRRVLRGVGANGFAQATTIAIQLASLPLFMSRWDLATYGQWVVISAIPSWLSLADVGMVTAAGNRMTMLAGGGDWREANRVFQSTLAFMCVVCGAVLLLALAALALLPLDGFGAGAAGAGDAANAAGHAAVAGHAGGAADLRLALAALAAGVVLALFGGLSEAIYRASGRYAEGTALANVVRLAEWGGMIGGLWFDGGFVAVAAGGLLMRALGTLALVLHSAWSAPKAGNGQGGAAGLDAVPAGRRLLRWGFADADRAEVRATVAPAFWFMAFPVANALSLQGLTLVVAARLGPEAAAIFNTCRTLARVTVQATGSYSHALWPEFSRLKGGDPVALAALYRRSQAIGLGIALAGSVLVYLVAPTVLDLWSRGRMPFDAPLMAVAMLYAGIAGAWHVPRILLLSTNEHSGLAVHFLVVSALTVPLAWWLAGQGAAGVMVSMAAAEAAMLLLCGLAARRSVGAAGLQVQGAST